MDTCASINLRRISRLVTSDYNEALRPTGLRCTQLAVLAAIGVGEHQSLTDIADTLNMDISTLTRAVTILEEKGLATSQSAGGRKKSVVLTDSGRRTVTEALIYWETAQQAFRENLGVDLCEMLCTALNSYLKPCQTV